MAFFCNQFGMSWISNILLSVWIFCHIGWASPCAKPSSSHPTDAPFYLNLDSDWVIPKPWSYFGEAISLLISRRPQGRRHAEAKIIFIVSLFVFLCFFNRSLKVLSHNWLWSEARDYSLHMTKAPVQAEEKLPPPGYIFQWRTFSFLFFLCAKHIFWQVQLWSHPTRIHYYVRQGHYFLPCV